MAGVPKTRQRTRNVSLSGVFCSTGIAIAVVILLLEITSGARSKSQFQADRATDEVIFSSYKILREFPHHEKAFTQGLLYYGNDTFYESTGLYGMSSVREVDLRSGKVKKIYNMKNTDFGEGLALWEDRLLQVAWQTNKGYLYQRSNLRPLGTFKHPMSDGWGLTHDGKHIIGSDGTFVLYFMDPETFTEIRRVSVKYNGREVRYLNELEYVKGEIWANVWQTECIARISPRDGRVVGWIILEGLRSTLIAEGYKYLDVLNGIAWDSQQDRLFVTGKTWPKLFEIALEPMTPEQQVSHTVCIR